MSLSRNCPVSSFPIVALFGGGTFDGLDRTCHSLAGFSHHELQLHGSQTPAAPHSINFDPIVVDMVIMVQDNPIYLPRCFCQCLFGFPFTLRQSLHEAFRRWQTRSRRVMVVCSLRYQHTQGGLSFVYYFDMAAIRNSLGSGNGFVFANSLSGVVCAQWMAIAMFVCQSLHETIRRHFIAGILLPH